MLEIILITLAIIVVILAIRGIFKWWSGINEVINNTAKTNELLQELINIAEKECKT